MSVFAYIRVSTEKQSLEVQHYEIEQYAKRNNITIDYWVEEKVSGAKDIKDRKIKSIIKRGKAGDIVLCTECSRLGRSITIIAEVMQKCLEKGIIVTALKESYTLSDNPLSKIIMVFYGFAAETERTLIRERTHEGLMARKRAGHKLGRPEGAKNKSYVLDEHKDKIVKMLNKGVPKTKIAKKFKVHTSTLYDFLKRHGLYESKKNSKDLETVGKIMDEIEKEINSENSEIESGGQEREAERSEKGKS